ncbi:MAG: hypothetical protein MUF33_02150 [Candidatus Nanopelagicales bacterium]|jgi:hypothetical protein|nr:hypothetical protein [Candidatus Nanopelagicales bacterium]
MSTLIVWAALTAVVAAALQHEWRRNARRAEADLFVARMIAVGKAIEHTSAAFGQLQEPLARAGAAFRELAATLEKRT